MWCKIVGMMLCLCVVVPYAGGRAAVGGAAPPETNRQQESLRSLAALLVPFSDEDYGGAYIAEDGQVVVCLTPSSPVRLIEAVARANAAPHSARLGAKRVRYSRRYLTQMVEAILPHMAELGFMGIGTDEAHNCVVIDSHPQESLAAVYDRLEDICQQAHIGFDRQAIAIQESPLIMTLTV